MRTATLLLINLLRSSQSMKTQTLVLYPLCVVTSTKTTLPLYYQIIFSKSLAQLGSQYLGSLLLFNQRCLQICASSSDHCTVLLIPAYKQALKQSKPTKRSIRIWSSGAIERLKACFECTGWNALQHQNDLNDFTTTVTEYIRFCENMCLRTKIVTQFPNNKQWFHHSIRSKLLAKDLAYKTKVSNPVKFRQAKADWRLAVKLA